MYLRELLIISIMIRFCIVHTKEKEIKREGEREKKYRI